MVWCAMPAVDVAGLRQLNWAIEGKIQKQLR
jgi:hypothetical protein